MRFKSRQLMLLCVGLLFGVALIGIPVTAHVMSTLPAMLEHPDKSFQSTYTVKEVEHSIHVIKTTGTTTSVMTPRQTRYDRRRQYWEDRVERRIDRRQEYLDQQTGGANDDEDADADNGNDNNDSDMAADDESGAEDDAIDQEIERVERRREYFRDRVDRRW